MACRVFITALFTIDLLAQTHTHYHTNAFMPRPRHGSHLSLLYLSSHADLHLLARVVATRPRTK